MVLVQQEGLPNHATGHRSFGTAPGCMQLTATCVCVCVCFYLVLPHLVFVSTLFSLLSINQFFLIIIVIIAHSRSCFRRVWRYLYIGNLTFSDICAHREADYNPILSKNIKLFEIPKNFGIKFHLHSHNFHYIMLSFSRD